MNDLFTQIALMDRMPLTFNALVVEYTSRCPAKCAMCYQSAGPKGSDIIGSATGGEAFLDQGMLLRLIAFARDNGFATLSTTTNGYWAATPARADAVCAAAWAAGLTGMEISWDHWHRPYVDAAAVNNCLEACARHGIAANLRILSTKPHSYHEALSLLRPDALACAQTITCAPVHPTGRAGAEIAPEDIHDQGTLDDTCHSILNLTVNARGDVSPCCAGLDQLSGHSFGNAGREDIGAIAARLNASPIIRTLVFRGVLHLRALLKDAGLDPGTGFTGICHMCWSIFSDPAAVRAIEDAYARRRRMALVAAMARLGAPEPAEA